MIMKISGNFTRPLKNHTPQNTTISGEKYEASPENTAVPAKYSQIAFGAIYNVKQKKFDIDAEKSKLLRQTEEILKSESQDADITDVVSNILEKELSKFRYRLKKQKELLAEAEALSANKTMSQKQKADKANELKKAFNLLMKNRTRVKENTPKKKIDEKIDFQLVNKFKSSISLDDFNLDKVYNEYYRDLASISTIKELNEKYPKIKTPLSPQEIIAKKMENTLTRDFYEELDELFIKVDKDKIFDFCNSKVTEMCDQIAQGTTFGKDEIYSKIAPHALKAILKKYALIKIESGFSSVPEFRKNKNPIVSKTDLDLLSVDFDKFVLDVIKKQYLQGQKLNNITYQQGNIKINAGALKEPEYKFEKVSERIKKLMTAATSITTAQRDYGNFDAAQLKNRLNFHASREIGNNEQLLENIIAFDSSSLESEDKAALIKFLKILDNVYDGKISAQEAVFEIKKKDIRSKEAERLNEIEKQKAAEIYKAEQKKNFELNSLKNSFDDAINLLFMNNLNGIANMCSKYRPENPDEETVKNAKFITEIINNHLKDKKEDEINKGKLESNIIRWDTYNYYKNNDPQSPLLVDALKFAKNKAGVIDTNKVGKYIINREIVENYPDSTDFVKYPELLSKIIEKTQNNTQKAVEYLCKFDEYQDLGENEKTHISKILSIFDSKDPVEKIIRKYVVENEYVKNDTTVLTNIYDNGEESVKATISSSAKQQILAKYKYPLCLEFMEDFEDALTSFATSKGSSGIKKTGRNNKAIEYKMELKLTGHNDRLFSSKNDFCFDIFSEKGIH